MYALSFDVNMEDLERNYEDSYSLAYMEIKKILEKDKFFWFQGNVYMSESNELCSLLTAISHLKEIEWFRKSVHDVRGYKVEEWSNFTNFVKG